ncbi:ATP-dependent helicase [Patescibacteria group bacterium]
MIIDMDILSDLNPEQQQAVTYGTGPLLIVAGAGTGKTTVITRRIAWLLLEKELKSAEVLAMTFTEKAAEEMETRVDQLLPLGYEDLWVNTFHEFGKRVLEENALEIGLDPGFKVLTEADQYMFVRQRLFEFDLKYYRPLGNPTKFIQALLKLFSRAKDEEIDESEFLRYAQKKSKGKSQKANRNQKTKIQKGIEVGLDLPEAEEEEAAKLVELAKAYKKYQEMMREEGYMDFGDLIMYTLKLFRTRKSVLERYRQQFKYILVDEFQDTNFAQYQIIKLLAAPDNNLAVVGDDDQSIYRFRGAALNNILNFKKHFPKAKEVVLKTNYRSAPGILEAAYDSIQGNNPDRLEKELGIVKKLKVGRELKLPGSKKVLPKPALLWTETIEKQAQAVVQKIADIKQAEKRDWKDFAILVRANAQADPFVKILERNNIPYQFVASKGLYTESEVVDLLAYLKTLDNFLDSTSLYRVTRIPIFKFDPQDVIRLLAYARRKRVALYEAMDNADNISGVKDATKKSIKKLFALLKNHARLARDKKVSEVLVQFLEDSGYMQILRKRDNLEEEQRFLNIVELFKRIQLFEQAGETQTVKDFVEELEVATEGGEDPAPAEIQEGPDTVKIMTIHKAKGLEFPVVFLVSLVEGHFPVRNMPDPLRLPDDLLEETLPEESHVQEERRLFYVAMTRAMDQLYLSGADDYGGKRKRRLSRFVKEVEDKFARLKPAAAKEISQQKLFKDSGKASDIEHPLPSKFSFTQLEAFQKCPLQYRFAHILHVPTSGSHTFSYGQSVHQALKDFFQEKLKGDEPAEKDLLAMLDNNWQDDFYETKSHEQQRYKIAQQALKGFCQKVKEEEPRTLYIEKGFNMKLGKYVLRGAIDRIDKISKDSVEIIDYKTGDSKKGAKDIKKPVQLLLYALATEQILGLQPEKLTLYYIDDNKPYSLERDKFEPKLQKTKEDAIKTMDAISESDFAATPSSHTCGYCDFKMICPYRK